MYRYLTIPLVLVLFGCATSPMPGNSITNKGQEIYQLNTGPDGSVYRINLNTGEVWVIEGDELEKIEELKSVRLEIGKKYFIEDNFSMIYLGKGKFTEPEEDYSYLWK